MADRSSPDLAVSSPSNAQPGHVPFSFSKGQPIADSEMRFTLTGNRVSFIRDFETRRCVTRHSRINTSQ